MTLFRRWIATATPLKTDSPPSSPFVFTLITIPLMSTPMSHHTSFGSTTPIVDTWLDAPLSPTIDDLIAFDDLDPLCIESIEDEHHTMKDIMEAQHRLEIEIQQLRKQLREVTSQRQVFEVRSKPKTEEQENHKKNLSPIPTHVYSCQQLYFPRTQRRVQFILPVSTEKVQPSKKPTIKLTTENLSIENLSLGVVSQQHQPYRIARLRLQEITPHKNPSSRPSATYPPTCPSKDRSRGSSIDDFMSIGLLTP